VAAAAAAQDTIAAGAALHLCGTGASRSAPPRGRAGLELDPSNAGMRQGLEQARAAARPRRRRHVWAGVHGSAGAQPGDARLHGAARLHGHAAGAGPRPVPDDRVRARPAAAHRALPPAAACHSKVSGWVSGPGTLTCAGVRGALRAARPLQRGHCWCARAGVPSRVSAARILLTVYIHSIRLGQKQHTPSAPNT